MTTPRGHRHGAADGPDEPAPVVGDEPPPELWLDWDQSTDDSDPQSLLLYDVYINGVLRGSRGDGYRRDGHLLPCRNGAELRIVVRAVDTFGNVSAPSNTIVITC